MKCTWPVRTLSKVQTIVQRNAAAVGVGALVSLEALDEGSIRTHQGQSGLRALGPDGGVFEHEVQKLFLDLDVTEEGRQKPRPGV